MCVCEREKGAEGCKCLGGWKDRVLCSVPCPAHNRRLRHSRRLHHNLCLRHTLRLRLRSRRSPLGRAGGRSGREGRRSRGRGRRACHREVRLRGQWWSGQWHSATGTQHIYTYTRARVHARAHTHHTHIHIHTQARTHASLWREATLPTIVTPATSCTPHTHTLVNTGPSSITSTRNTALCQSQSKIDDME